MDAAFIQTLIDNIKLQIIAYQNASLALASGGIQSYTLDTGQTVQKVTALDLEWITSTIDSLMNQCATLEARLNGAALQSRPAW